MWRVVRGGVKWETPFYRERLVMGRWSRKEEWEMGCSTYAGGGDGADAGDWHLGGVIDAFGG